MSSEHKATGMLEDKKIDVKPKLSALWVSIMMLYIYVDIFHFFQPGAITDILEGKVWEFDITPTWAFGSLVLMTIPALMIFLSLALPAKLNRRVNIVVAIVYVVIAIGNPLGESWGYIWLGSAVEIVLLALIIWYAWKWPKQEAAL